MSRVLVLKGREGGAASEACHEARLERSGEPHYWVLGFEDAAFQVRMLYNSLITYVFLLVCCAPSRLRGTEFFQNR